MIVTVAYLSVMFVIAYMSDETPEPVTQEYVINVFVTFNSAEYDVIETEPPQDEYTTFEATAYTARCDGCIGITKSGVDVRSTIYHEGKRVIAVDPDVIPLGTTVEVRLADGTTFEAIAEDVGSDIQGRRIDVLHRTYDRAMRFGRQDVEVRVIDGE